MEQQLWSRRENGKFPENKFKPVMKDFMEEATC